MDLFYEDSLHLIKEGNELLAKEVMAFYKKLSSTVYNPPPIFLYKKMASFSYNTDHFPPLPSNGDSRQLTSVYISVKPREQNSKVVSFSNTVNLLLFEKNVFLCTSKAYMFPLKSDEIFRSDTSYPVLSRKSFVCATTGPSHACFPPIPPIVIRNCKNIRNCSIGYNSVRSSSSNVDRVSKPVYPVVSSSDSVKNISKSPKFTPSNSHSVDSSTSSFRVVSHRNIQGKCKLRKSSSFVKSANNHDISNKCIVGRD